MSRVVGDRHPFAVQSRLVLGGIRLLLGEYEPAKALALHVADDFAASFSERSIAMLLPATLLSHANYGLDRFGEAARDLMARILALSTEETSTPLAAYARFVALCASRNTAEPPTARNPPEAADLQNAARAVSLSFGEECETSKVVQVQLAEALIGYELHEEYAEVERPLVAAFFEAKLPPSHIELH
jgi:hypothetical protein